MPAGVAAPMLPVAVASERRGERAAADHLTRAGKDLAPAMDVSCDLTTMTAIWMGWERVRAAVEDGRTLLTGDGRLAANRRAWPGLSPFAKTR
jgi:hypothetical protein